MPLPCAGRTSDSIPEHAVLRTTQRTFFSWEYEIIIILDFSTLKKAQNDYWWKMGLFSPSVEARGDEGVGSLKTPNAESATVLEHNALECPHPLSCTLVWCPWKVKWKWKPLSRFWLCNPSDYTVRGILQARILEWVAFPFSRGSSQPRDQTQVSRIAVGKFFTSWATKEAHACL